MSYRFREDIAIADVAFEAQGKTLAGLFTNAALAVTNTMVKDLRALGHRVVKNIELEASDIEMLLYRFLQELVFYKDAETLLFGMYSLDIREESGQWRLKGVLRGDELSPERHELAADVKAVSLHNFRVRKTKHRWIAEVILDV